METRPIYIKPVAGPIEALFDKNAQPESPAKGLPTSTNFFVIPINKPHLRSFVRSLSWNYAARKLDLWIGETSAMSTYDWINDLSTAGQALVLVLMDENDNEIGQFRFSDLSVMDHACHFDSKGAQSAFGIDGHEAMMHYLCLSYQKLEKNAVTDEATDDWAVTDLEICTAD